MLIDRDYWAWADLLADLANLSPMERCGGAVDVLMGRYGALVGANVGFCELARLHEAVQSYLVRLVDGFRIVLSPEMTSLIPVRRLTRGRMVTEWVSREGPPPGEEDAGWIRVDFILTARPHFPWTRCLTCGTIFAARGRGIYCAEKCKKKASRDRLASARPAEAGDSEQ